MLAIHSIERPIFFLVVDERYSAPRGQVRNHHPHKKDLTPRSVRSLTTLAPPPPTPQATHVSKSLKAGLARWAASYQSAHDILILTSTQPGAVETANALADAAGSDRPAMRGALSPVGFVKGGTPRPHGSAGVLQSESFQTKFGETVASLVDRLEPIALELEAAAKPVVIVAYEAPCRTLRALVSFALGRFLILLPFATVCPLANA